MQIFATIKAIESADDDDEVIWTNCECTYTFLCGGSATLGPGVTDGLSESGGKDVPGVSVGVSVSAGASITETGEGGGVLLAWLLSAQPLVVIQSSFNCVDHCALDYLLSIKF